MVVGKAVRKAARLRVVATCVGLLPALLALPHVWSDARADGWQSGAQIASICRADPAANAVAVTFCLGYLQGTLDAFLLGRSNCIPAGTDANGLRQAVIAHLDRHPDRAGASGPALVFDAFRAAWPACGHMPAYSR
jgi:hypothetical protein